MDLSFLPSFMTQPMSTVANSAGVPICTVPQIVDPTNAAAVTANIAANCPQLVGQTFAVSPVVTYQMSMMGWVTLGALGLLAFKMMK